MSADRVADHFDGIRGMANLIAMQAARIVELRTLDNAYDATDTVAAMQANVSKLAEWIATELLEDAR